jgi:hypothetical protein
MNMRGAGAAGGGTGAPGRRRRALRWGAALVVGALLASSAAALADEPSSGDEARGQPTAASGVIANTTVAGTATVAGSVYAGSGGGAGAAGDQEGQHGHGTGGKGEGEGHAFGLEVAAAVQQALSGGATGTAVAQAVHDAIEAEKSDAKGIAVAEAVYAGLTGGGAASASGATPPAVSFSDMEEAPWAAAAVGALAQAGVVNGTGNGQFSPSAPVTGSELVTMLARLAAFQGTGGTPSQGSGVPAWAQAGVAYAQQAGVLQGVEGLSDLSEPLTRAQAVTMLINALGMGQAAAQASQAQIALQGDVPPWAHGAVALAVQLGLLQGSGGQVLADQVLTRAQMAVLLARLAYLEALLGQQAQP